MKTTDLKGLNKDEEREKLISQFSRYVRLNEPLIVQDSVECSKTKTTESINGTLSSRLSEKISLELRAHISNSDFWHDLFVDMFQTLLNDLHVQTN